MSKAEYTDYLIRSIQAKGNEHALEVAAGTCICGRAVAPYVKDITCLDLTEVLIVPAITNAITPAITMYAKIIVTNAITFSPTVP